MGIGQSATINLAGAFTDPDPADELEYDATSSHPSIATVSESNSIVTVTGRTAGTAAVTVTATDGADASGQFVAQTFEVTVVPDPVNQPPVAALALPAVELGIGQTHTVNLEGAFTDPEGDPLVYERPTTTRADVATVSAISTGSFTVQGVSAGTATITVGATDRNPGPGRPAVQTFEVTVVPDPVNQPPVAARQLPAVSLYTGQTHTVDLGGTFDDPEGDPLTYVAPTTSRSDVATVSGIASGTFAVTAVAPGIATVTVGATDGHDGAGRPAVQTFDVTVEPPPANLPPEVGRALDDLDLDIGATARVSLADAFNDPDGDALAYAVTTARADVAIVSPVGSGSETFDVRGVAAGASTITITANDDTSRPQRAAVQTIEVTVALAAPSAPEGLKVVSAGFGAATVSWTVLPQWWDVTTYQVDVQSPEDVELPFASPLTDILASPVKVDGLLPGAYRFRVRAVNEVGEGDWSAPVVYEVPVPEQLLVGIDLLSVDFPFDPDKPCIEFVDWRPEEGSLAVTLNRPALELDRAVTGIILVEDPTGHDGRIVLRGGGCYGVSERCFVVPRGETRVMLKARMACGEEPVQLGDRFRVSIREDVRPAGAVMVDEARNNIDVVIGRTVPALPLWAAGVLAALLARGARRRHRGSGGRYEA